MSWESAEYFCYGQSARGARELKQLVDCERKLRRQLFKDRSRLVLTATKKESPVHATFAGMNYAEQRCSKMSATILLNQQG